MRYKKILYKALGLAIALQFFIHMAGFAQTQYKWHLYSTYEPTPGYIYYNYCTNTFACFNEIRYEFSDKQYLPYSQTFYPFIFTEWRPAAPFCDDEFTLWDYSTNAYSYVNIYRPTPDVDNIFGELYFNPSYVGNINFKIQNDRLTGSSCGLDFTRYYNKSLCRMAPPGQFGVGYTDQSGPIQSSSGSATINFQWSSNNGNYCDEVFNDPNARMQVQLVSSSNGYPTGISGEFGVYQGGSRFGGGSYTVNGFGKYVFVVRMKDKFGQWYYSGNLEVDVVPSCYNDGASNISLLDPTSSPVPPVDGGYGSPAGGYVLQQNTTYTLNMNSVTDFCNFYSLVTDDGSTDPSTVSSSASGCQPDTRFSGDHLDITQQSPGVYTIKIKDPIGSYRVYAVKKPVLNCNSGVFCNGSSYCSGFSPISIFVGGQNLSTTTPYPCLLDLPVELKDVFPQLNPVASSFGVKYILAHFTYTIESRQGIIVHSDDPSYPDGMVLQDGAILRINTDYQQPEEEKIDNNQNWSQVFQYDDEGQLIGASKIFSDSRGRITQAQVKNLTERTVLASETIYDKYGRAVLSTLPAPVKGREIATSVTACGDDVQAGADIYFLLKTDFITSGNKHYSFSNFDNYASVSKLNTPDVLDNTAVGTLGWYYSNNNVASAAVNTAKGQGNFIEPYVAKTDYPFTRAIYEEDGTGDVQGSTSPGDQYTPGSNHYNYSQRQKLSSADWTIIDNYLTIRNTHVFTATTNSTTKPADHTQMTENLYKVYSRDAMGKETYIYVDNDGQTLATQYVLTGDIAYNFYDDKGRIVTSITPNGVDVLITNGITDHNLYNRIDKTTYKYNHRGWVVQINEPDAGITNYKYRKDGNIRFSQNARQVIAGSFSYTHYDRLGRPVESGEYLSSGGGTTWTSITSDILEAIIINSTSNGGLTGGLKNDVVYIVYDSPDETSQISGLIDVQEFLSGNVAYTWKDDGSKTWYSYDERRRIIWTSQYLPGMAATSTACVKTTSYTYHPNGNVKEMAYQKGKVGEEFYHSYTYDADARLSGVYTSNTAPIYDAKNQPVVATKQAAYDYYLHGPLKRTTLRDHLQGIDYTYTAQGNLKAINHYDWTLDPGKDGGSGSPVFKDAFGMTVDYHTGDYAKTGTSISSLDMTYVPQSINYFNGNVRDISWFSRKPASSTVSEAPVAYSYFYDDKYQYSDSYFGIVYNGQFIGSGNSWYEGVINYDRNGNITSLQRNANSTLTHNMSYQYNTISGANHNNRLERVQNFNNNFTSYTYDAIGRTQAIGYNGTPTRYVDYDARNSIIGVYANSSLTQRNIKYYLDNNELRYKKEIYDPQTHILQYTTWYVRDASGNVIAIYDDNNNSHILQKTEQNIYGQERIGLVEYQGTAISEVYELHDHLGNIRAMISSSGNILSFSDYYPFGMEMPGRNSQLSPIYKYAYQGLYAEKDQQTGLNSYDLRDYDPITGRWLSLDFFDENFSPYIGMGNNPIANFDPDGALPWSRLLKNIKFNKSALTTRQLYGPRSKHPVTGKPKMHYGVDLPASKNTGILAAADGKVAWTGYMEGYGNAIVLNHGKGYYSVYGHLNNGKTYVDVGDEINEGDEIGGVGNTGVGTGPHLHFEFYKGVKDISQVLVPGHRKEVTVDPTTVGDIQKYIFGQKMYNFKFVFKMNLAPKDNTNYIGKTRIAGDGKTVQY